MMMKVLETENLSRGWLGQAIVRWSVPRITTARVRQWTKGRLQLTGGTNGRHTNGRHRDRLRQRREDVFLPNGVDRRRADVGHVLLELLVHALGIRGIDAIHPDPRAQPLAAVALAAEGVTLARQRDEREFVLQGERGVIPHVVRGEVPVGHAVGEDVEILRTEVAPLVGGGGEGVQALARYGDLLQASTGFGQGGNNVRAVADPPLPASVAVVCRGSPDGITSEVTRGGGGGPAAAASAPMADRMSKRITVRNAIVSGVECIVIRKRERVCGLARVCLAVGQGREPGDLNDV